MIDPPSAESKPARPPAGHDPYSALRVRDFRFYLSGNVLANMGMHMQTIAVGWEIYERTGSALALGWVGLVEFGPVALLALPAGQLADRMDRRRIVLTAQLFIAAASLGLAGVSALHGPILAMYGFLFLSATARAVQQPAKHSLLPQIVPRAQFSNAVTWNSGGFELSAMVGPAIGGVLIALFRQATFVYALDAAATLTFAFLLSLMKSPPRARSAEAATLRSLMAGFSFVWNTQIILGAITLDLFAVLLGGAVTLLPVFAKDILAVGPLGLGLMRAAPSLGALSMSFLLAHLPPMKKAGRNLLVAVGGFGLATVVFGFSRNFPLSLVMLYLLGAFDTVSVVVRHTLVQLLTPDEMRGRVSAINGIFIGASNQLGGAESGFVAWFFGATFSVVSGGVGTLIVVLLVTWLWPEVRRYGQLGQQPAPAPVVEAEVTRESELKVEAT